MQINEMRVLSPYTYNTPPGQLRPAKLEKYLARSRFKAIRSHGASESAIQLSNSNETGNNNCNVNIYSKNIKNKKTSNYNADNNTKNYNNTKSNSIIYLDSLDINHSDVNDSAFNSRLSTKSSLYKKAYIEAKIFPKPNLSHITTNQAVQPQSSRVQNNSVKPEKVISNKLKLKVNNSTMSTSSSVHDKKATFYHRPSWIIMDDDSEKMNSSPPPTISLNERFSNLPVNKKRDKEKGKHKKKRTRRTSIPSNTWISIKKTKEDNCKQKRRAPKIDDDDDDDNDQDQMASIRVKDDSFSHSEYSSNGLNDNENNSGSIRSEPSILDDLDVITADIDDNLLVDCMLTDWSDMDFILDPNMFDLSKLEESMMSE